MCHCMKWNLKYNLDLWYNLLQNELQEFATCSLKIAGHDEWWALEHNTNERHKYSLD